MGTSWVHRAAAERHFYKLGIIDRHLNNCSFAMARTLVLCAIMVAMAVAVSDEEVRRRDLLAGLESGMLRRSGDQSEQALSDKAIQYLGIIFGFDALGEMRKSGGTPLPCCLLADKFDCGAATNKEISKVFEYVVSDNEKYFCYDPKDRRGVDYCKCNKCILEKDGCSKVGTCEKFGIPLSLTVTCFQYLPAPLKYHPQKQVKRLVAGACTCRPN